MIRNFFTVALRNISRQKSYFVINTTGLAIGIASSIIILLFVINELSYDRFHEKHKQIFRLYVDGKIGGFEIKGAWTAAPTSKALIREIPEIADEVRTDTWGEVVLKAGDNSYVEKKFLLADTSFFRIFSFPLLKGDADTALAAPYSIVLTEDAAERYFGNEDPIGKKVFINTDTNRFTVTGVMKNVPQNSHFEFNVVGSFSTHRRSTSDNWLSNSFSTYLLLKPGISYKDVEKKIKPVVEKHIGPQLQAALDISIQEWEKSGNRYELFLQPIDNIHLNPAIQHNARPSNNEKYVYIFSLVALLIIFVAVINYMNLSTAKSVKRAKEVGLRKVSGSSRKLLIGQFLVESVILSFISLFLAIILVQLTLPFINRMTNLNLNLDFFSHWYYVPALILLTVGVGIMAGSYPSFYLSSFKPVAVISGLKTGKGKSILRNVLVVFQFSVSIIIILSAIIIYRQINYMFKKDLGFNKEQLLIIKNADGLGNFYKIKDFQKEIKQIQGVISSSNSTGVPNHTNESRTFLLEGKDIPADHTILLNINYVDEDFINTYNIRLNRGRFLSYDRFDSLSIVINESTVKNYGFSEPLSVRIIQPDTVETRSLLNVIGVVDDFHYESFRENIHPYAFILKPRWWDWGGYISVRVAPDNMKKTIHQIEEVWQKLAPSDPFQYYFLDDEFNIIYSEELRTGNITLGFAILAMVIACLGLFGLTSYASEQRTKEIGIRKVLGSSIAGIILLLTRQVFYLIVVSTLIAWPVAFFIMKKWLNNFSFHAALTIWEFIFSFLIALVIAMVTVTYKAYTAAAGNPVKALKYE